jgi:hypothetical protein
VDRGEAKRIRGRREVEHQIPAVPLPREARRRFSLPRGTGDIE